MATASLSLTPAPSKPRTAVLPSLQIGRGIAALAVLLYHANLITGLDKYYGIRPADVFMAGKGGVEYFFVLSGFVMVVAHWGDLRSNPDLGSFIWKRFRRLYPILWIVLLPLMVLVSVQPTLSPAGTVNLSDYMYALLSGPPLGGAKIEPFLVVQWSLRYEIVFYGLFLLLLVSRTLFLLAAAPLLVGGLASLSSAEIEGGSFWISAYFLLFFMGLVGGWAFKSDRIQYPRLLLGSGLFILLACVLLGPTSSFTPALTVGFGLAAALVIAGAAGLDGGAPSRLGSLFNLLGDASYAIYLVHYPILSLATKATIRLTASPTLSFLAASMTAVAGGIVCHLLIERPMLRRLPTRMPAWPRIA